MREGFFSGTKDFDDTASERRDEARGRKGSPMEWVACDIVVQATRDWKRYKHLRTLPHNAGGIVSGAFDLARSAGFASPRDQLIEFFNGEFFRELCEIVGTSVDPDKIVKHLEIPDVEPVRFEVQMVLLEAEL